MSADLSARPSKPKKEERFIINVTLANDGEPRDIFVGGCEEGDFLITRGKDVTVPRSVLNRLDDAVGGYAEVNPEDNTNTVNTARRRFPYSIVGTVAA